MTAGLTSALSFSPPGAKKIFSNVDTGLYMRASAARTNLIDLGFTGSLFKVDKNAGITLADASNNSGFFCGTSLSLMPANGLKMSSNHMVGWSAAFNTTIETQLTRAAAYTILLSAGTNPCALRVSGNTATSKYLSLTHDGTNGTITTSAGKLILLGNDGVQLGTSGASYIGFYGVTPGARPGTGVSPASFVENAGGTAVNTDSTFGGYTIQQLAQALQNLGLID